jgi:hypothetical protein
VRDRFVRFVRFVGPDGLEYVRNLLWRPEQIEAVTNYQEQVAVCMQLGSTTGHEPTGLAL